MKKVKERGAQASNRQCQIKREIATVRKRRREIKESERQTDRQTDRQIDRWNDG